MIFSHQLLSSEQRSLGIKDLPNLRVTNVAPSFEAESPSGGYFEASKFFLPGPNKMDAQNEIHFIRVK